MVTLYKNCLRTDLGVVDEVAAVDLRLGGAEVGLAEVHLGGEREVVVEELAELHHHRRETPEENL